MPCRAQIRTRIMRSSNGCWQTAVGNFYLCWPGWLTSQSCTMHRINAMASQNVIITIIYGTGGDGWPHPLRWRSVYCGWNSCCDLWYQITESRLWLQWADRWFDLKFNFMHGMNGFWSIVEDDIVLMYWTLFILFYLYYSLMRSYVLFNCFAGRQSAIISHSWHLCWHFSFRIEIFEVSHRRFYTSAADNSNDVRTMG